MPLTQQEIEAIRREAEALYPQGISVGDIDLKPLVVDTHIAATIAERERVKDLQNENIELKKRLAALSEDYNQLSDQAQIWREESGN